MFQSLPPVKEKLFSQRVEKSSKQTPPLTPDQPWDPEEYSIPARVSIPVQHSPSPPNAASEAEAGPNLFDEHPWNDCRDIDYFDLSRARQENDEKLILTKLLDESPSLHSLEELLPEQWTDPFRQTALSRQSRKKDDEFFEDDQDFLLKGKAKFRINV